MTEISIIIGIILIGFILWVVFLTFVVIQILKFLETNSPFDVIIKDADVDENK
jgi:uncharacterized SAM-binding protein YcdF (DUF218 family)